MTERKLITANDKYVKALKAMFQYYHMEKIGEIFIATVLDYDKDIDLLLWQEDVSSCAIHEAINCMFTWSKTKQGYSFWERQYHFASSKVPDTGMNIKVKDFL